MPSGVLWSPDGALALPLPLLVYVPLQGSGTEPASVRSCSQVHPPQCGYHCEAIAVFVRKQGVSATTYGKSLQATEMLVWDCGDCGHVFRRIILVFLLSEGLDPTFTDGSLAEGTNLQELIWFCRAFSWNQRKIYNVIFLSLFNFSFLLQIYFGWGALWW